MTRRLRPACACAMVVAACVVATPDVGTANAALAAPFSSTEAASPSVAAAWLSGAEEAMGGETNMKALDSSEVAGVSVWFHREQSERPEGPWLTSFTDFVDVRRFDADTVQRTSRSRGFSTNDWIDSVEWSPRSTVFIVSGASFSLTGVTFGAAPTPPDLEALPVALAPERVLRTAAAATDLRAARDEIVDGYAHHVLTFSWQGAAVRLILNVPSLLPKAIEIRRAHVDNMMLSPWGDVTQRITFGMWTLEPEGLRYPRLWEFSTDGSRDGSVSITRVQLNPREDPAAFELRSALRQMVLNARTRIDELPLGLGDRPIRALADGVTKLPGRFDIVEVKQEDGVVIIDAPLSSQYSAQVIADAQRRYVGLPIKAVITTSDAWPHIGGLREYAARGVPIYTLDLNLPIVTRLLAAKYESSPDAWARSHKAVVLKKVSQRTVVGSGDNRLAIYPFRTVTGERQMMIYWPARRLLYTSDLFTIRQSFVFLPQQVREAVQAVARERLDVSIAFGAHYDPLPWSEVLRSASPRPIAR